MPVKLRKMKIIIKMTLLLLEGFKLYILSNMVLYIGNLKVFNIFDTNFISQNISQEDNVNCRQRFICKFVYSNLINNSKM